MNDDGWEVVTDDGWEPMPLRQVYNNNKKPKKPDLTPEETLTALVHGAGQGATFGFLDEAMGAVGTPFKMGYDLLTEGKLTGPDEAYTSIRDNYRNKYNTVKEHAPFTTATGDVVGSLGSGVGLFNALKAIKLAPKTFIGSTLFGAGEGTLQTVGRGTDSETYIQQAKQNIPLGAITGGAGYAAAETAKRIARGGSYQPIGKRQIQADELNIELSPSQKYDDDFLQTTESMMRNDPGFRQPFMEMDARNAQQANRIAAKSIGLPDKTNKITEDEFGAASDHIRDMFNKSATKGEYAALDQQWMDDLDNIEQAYNKRWGKSDATDPLIADARKASDAQFITPHEYQKQYSNLGDELNKAAKDGDIAKVELYASLRDAMDTMLDRTFPGRASEIQKARDLYRNKKIMEGAGILDTNNGNISPLKLGNYLRRVDKRGFMEGKNQSDLYNLARVAQATKMDINQTMTGLNSKGLVDWLTSPLKASAANIYLSGKRGTGFMQGPAGGGNISNPLVNAVMSLKEFYDTPNQDQ